MVSIIIPCYNREHYISDAIDSCLRQTYKNIEIIVVDDGSSDGSVDLIKSKYGHKVHLLEQKNKGSASARNTGLLSANGEFVIFLDSDDWLSDDLVECHIQTITKWADVEICCADSVAVISDGSMSELKKITLARNTIKSNQFIYVKSATVSCMRNVSEKRCKETWWL